jgi:hypothetical protein
MKTGLLDPGFRYIPAASHDNDSRAFRRRMRRRQREAQVAAEASRANVQPIVTKKQAQGKP